MKPAITPQEPVEERGLQHKLRVILLHLGRLERVLVILNLFVPPPPSFPPQPPFHPLVSNPSPPSSPSLRFLPNIITFTAIATDLPNRPPHLHRARPAPRLPNRPHQPARLDPKWRTISATCSYWTHAFVAMLPWAVNSRHALHGVESGSSRARIRARTAWWARVFNAFERSWGTRWGWR